MTLEECTQKVCQILERCEQGTAVRRAREARWGNRSFRRTLKPDEVKEFRRLQEELAHIRACAYQEILDLFFSKEEQEEIFRQHGGYYYEQIYK
jgi:hypothetical protein